MIIKKIKDRIVKEDEGFTFPLGLVVFLVLILLFLLIFEYLHFLTFFNQIDGAAERSVIGVATQNWDRAYQTVREGYAGGYEKKASANTWAEALNKESIQKQMKEILSVEEEGGKWVKKDDEGNTLYWVIPSSVEATIINTPFGSVGTGKGLEVEVTYHVGVNWAFRGNWEGIPPIEINRKVKAVYRPKF